MAAWTCTRSRADGNAIDYAIDLFIDLHPRARVDGKWLDATGKRWQCHPRARVDGNRNRGSDLVEAPLHPPARGREASPIVLIQLTRPAPARAWTGDISVPYILRN